MAHVADAPALADRAGEVGQLPPAQLVALGRRLHHLGVEPHAAGHGEQLVLAAHGHPPEVDAAASAADEDVHGPVRTTRDAEVAGQQVARPHRDDPERDRRLGQLLDDLEDGAIAAHGHDDIDMRLHRARGGGQLQRGQIRKIALRISILIDRDESRSQIAHDRGGRRSSYRRRWAKFKIQRIRACLRYASE